jgi:hypothetical protein
MWKLLDYNLLMTFFDKEYENIFLDRWSHIGKMDKKSTKG